MRLLAITSWMVGCLAFAGGGLAAQESAGTAKGEKIPPPIAPAVDPCPPACVETYKACVPVPGVKVKTKVVYGCREIDYCLPKCGLFGCKDACTTGNCETVARTKRVLLKKVVTEECPTTNCVVEERVKESCPAPCPRLPHGLHGHHHGSQGTVGLPAEPIPAPPVAPTPLPKGEPPSR